MRSQLTVADLYPYRQRSDLASFQQSHDFQTLDQGIQKLITNLLEGPKSFEELRTVIRKENEETREHISKALQQQQNQLQEKEYRERFVNSLWFDEIHSREETIVDAHGETFEWIFGVSDHAVGPWDNFIRWLESGQGTYWINGKAGSGKSTLMSFLCQDDRTMESLRSWSENQNKNVFMPKFFFWSAGKQMEKSIEGLLRSLIWQVLQFLPDLEITSIASHSRETLAAWTVRRLQKTLRGLLQQASSSHFFCFFIDGLDEYEGDQVDLIHFIQELVQSNAVKVCLSSRPYRVFDQAFGLSARLRLQDLTQSDMQKFVVNRFQAMPQVQIIAVQRADWLDEITSNILARADGVFLWVALAVKDQIRGLENGDSLEQLRGRLDSLPDEVEGIYARMLSQIEKVYRKEASIFLRLAGSHRSILDFVLASQNGLDDMLSSSDSLPEKDLIAKSHLARQRIGTTCAGLLEINNEYEVESHEYSNSIDEDSPLESENAFLEPHSTSLTEDASSESEDVSLKSEKASQKPDNASDDTLSNPDPDRIQFQGEATDDDIFDLDRKVTVNFIHRTARDFMRDAAQGGAFLKANTPSGFHPRVSFVKVLLAKARLFGSNDKRNFDVGVHIMMINIRLAEKETQVAQTQLCDLTDDVMSRIDRICGPWPTNTHWSVRWAGNGWRSMHKDLLTLDHKASSPSSSNDSFHSVSTQPVSNQPDAPDELRKTLVKSPDFLAFAVHHGLHRYVQQVLHDRKEPLNADTVSYLLYCAVHSSSLNLLRFLLTQEFLRQAGNPNLKDPCSKMTTWSAFLGRMKWLEKEGDDLRRAYMETTVVFVEKGANLHSICKFWKDASWSHGYSLIIDLSSLAVIELCFKDLPGYSYLGRLCADKGAPYYLRCTQVTITDLQRGSERDFEVSDSESTGILEIYKRFFANGSSKRQLENEMVTYLNELFHDRLEDVSELGS